MTAPTHAETYTRKAAALVRYGTYAGAHAGKPRFSYDPCLAPVTFLEKLLTPAEVEALNDARNVLVLPADSNVADVRLLLPDAFTGRARAVLVRLQTTFPHPDEVPGAYAIPMTGDCNAHEDDCRAQRGL